MKFHHVYLDVITLFVAKFCPAFASASLITLLVTKPQRKRYTFFVGMAFTRCTLSRCLTIAALHYEDFVSSIHRSPSLNGRGLERSFWSISDFWNDTLSTRSEEKGFTAGLFLPYVP